MKLIGDAVQAADHRPVFIQQTAIIEIQRTHLPGRPARARHGFVVVVSLHRLSFYRPPHISAKFLEPGMEVETFHQGVVVKEREATIVAASLALKTIGSCGGSVLPIHCYEDRLKPIENRQVAIRMI